MFSFIFFIYFFSFLKFIILCGNRLYAINVVDRAEIVLNLEHYFEGWLMSSVLILDIELEVIAESYTHTHSFDSSVGALLLCDNR